MLKFENNAIRRALFVFSLSLCGILRTAHAEECSTFSLPLALEVNSFYSDKKGSVIDAKLRSLYDAKLLPIKNGRDYVGKLIDDGLKNGDRDKLDCGLFQLRRWADGQALSAPLTNLEALYNRPLFTLSFALEIIKVDLSSDRQDLRPIQEWLLMLARDDVRAYERERGIRNNIYYWAGAMAAAVSLFDSDREMADFADNVWAQAMAEADVDGSFPQEMLRGQRALTYQLYATDALLVLERLRATRGGTLSPAGRLTWRRVIGFTERSLCDPSALSKTVGVKQEAVDPRALLPLSAFGGGLPGGPAPKCVGQPKNEYDYMLGGDVNLLASILNKEAASSMQEK